MMNSTSSGRALLLSASLLLVGSTACRHGHRHRVVVVNPTGTVASDFQSIADYLADPTVRFLLDRMPRNSGSSPPDVEGEYDAAGVIVRTSIPGTRTGDDVIADFCFGTPSASSLEVLVQDPSVVDAGARSFVEGSGDDFTVYTAFKSVQSTDIGTTCEIHEVNVFSATREADGSLSDLFIGQAIVGLVGDCASLLVGDFQISENAADRVGGSCFDEEPGTGPGDPRDVLVEVENALVVDLLVFLDDDTEPTLLVGPESVEAFETRPGFAIFFETLQPVAGQDDDGNDLLMGEIVSGQFPADVTAAGGAIAYAIENRVGDDFFFAPLPVNRKSFDIFAVTNAGVDVPGYPDPPGSGLDCQCSMAPSLDPYVIGYYSYDAPGIIRADQANVRFFRVSDGREVDVFQGPFNLEAASGTVTLLVE
ncbi:MAG: hypothetical protein HY721_06585 [Planctomycetes bacterium]|nr:hypothetical protein [Planctomycetota bacterium]